MDKQTDVDDAVDFLRELAIKSYEYPKMNKVLDLLQRGKEYKGTLEHIKVLSEDKGKVVSLKSLFGQIKRAAENTLLGG